MEVCLSVTMELPNINSVILRSRNDHPIVLWVENCINKWISVPYKRLEKVWYTFLGIVVPYLE